MTFSRRSVIQQSKSGTRHHPHERGQEMMFVQAARRAAVPCKQLGRISRSDDRIRPEADCPSNREKETAVAVTFSKPPQKSVAGE